LNAQEDARPLVTGAAAKALGVGYHALHVALVFFGLLGWLIPSAPWLITHLIFIPSLIVVWALNKGVWPLNNLESRLTTARWRNPANAEEGSFIVAIVARYLNLHPTQRTMDHITYALMALARGFSWLHLSGPRA
jgi:hypothetical protein